jgi:hypothetical protein
MVTGAARIFHGGVGGGGKTKICLETYVEVVQEYFINCHGILRVDGYNFSLKQF